MVGEALDALLETPSMKPLDRLGDLGVEGPAAIVEQTRVGDFVDQRVFEGVLEIREKARLVEELSRQEVVEAGAQHFL